MKYWGILLPFCLSLACAFQTQTTHPSFAREKSLATNPHYLTLLKLADTDDEGLGLKRVKIGDRDFWTQQKELVEEMEEKSSRSLKQEQKEKFAARRLALVSDTAYFGFFIFCGT